MAVGNLLMLGHLVDKRFYNKTLPKEYMEESNVARFHYTQLRKHFAQNYSVKVDGQLVSPSAIFRRSFIKFAASLVMYKWWAYDEKTDGTACTPQLFEHHVEKMIREEYPESSWEHKLQRKCPLHMHWTLSSLLHIRTRQPEDGESEMSELEADEDGDSEDSDDSMDTGDSEDSGDEKNGKPFPSRSAITFNKKRRGSGRFYMSLCLCCL